MTGYPARTCGSNGKQRAWLSKLGDASTIPCAERPEDVSHEYFVHDSRRLLLKVKKLARRRTHEDRALGTDQGVARKMLPLVGLELSEQIDCTANPWQRFLLAEVDDRTKRDDVCPAVEVAARPLRFRHEQCRRRSRRLAPVGELIDGCAREHRCDRDWKGHGRKVQGLQATSRQPATGLPARPHGAATWCPTRVRPARTACSSRYAPVHESAPSHAWPHAKGAPVRHGHGVEMLVSAAAGLRDG